MVSTREFIEWAKEYDTSNVMENELDLKGIAWKHCFSFAKGIIKERFQKE